MSALGMIEVYGYTTSIVIADTVAKAAEVKVVAIDKNKPANADSVEVPLVMVVKFEGNAAAVQSALEAGVAEAERRGLYITSKVIAGLDPQVEWFANLTATGKDKFRNIETSDKKAKK
jgi:microcompartment protein CcmL/EutN